MSKIYREFLRFYNFLNYLTFNLLKFSQFIKNVGIATCLNVPNKSQFTEFSLHTGNKVTFISEFPTILHGCRSIGGMSQFKHHNLTESYTISTLIIPNFHSEILHTYTEILMFYQLRKVSRLTWGSPMKFHESTEGFPNLNEVFSWYLRCLRSSLVDLGVSMAAPRGFPWLPREVSLFTSRGFSY